MTSSVISDHGQVTRISSSDNATLSGLFCDDVLAFYAMWRRKRGARNIPSRADFDPMEMKGFLAGITLIDVVEDSRRFVYRLVGTREVAMRDNDPTGKGVAEGYFAASADAALAAYQDVVDRLAPRFERRRFKTPDDRIGNEESVLLPLSDDGVHINKIIAYTHHFLA
jgi:hypothetical protein